MKRADMTPYSVALFVFLAGLFQGCRERPESPCERSLILDKAVILKKADHKLTVMLHEVPETPFNRALVVSVQNTGNTRYEGYCDTLFSVSREGTTEFIIAFTPERTDSLAISTGENEKGCVVLEHQISPLTLNPGEKYEFIGHHHLNPGKNAGHPKYIGRLYDQRQSILPSGDS